MIFFAANRGVYTVLDLHHYRARREEDLDFWKDAAVRYKNNPAVLFDLINEPHGTRREVWRNGGGVLKKRKGRLMKMRFFRKRRNCCTPFRSTG
ncbi:MAG: cellulase family glycosylhydrolase [Opitutales bacterium]